jgi:hypothetical protein
MMSFSPPGQRDPGAGIEPASTGSEPAVLPLDDPGRSQQPVAVAIPPAGRKDRRVRQKSNGPFRNSGPWRELNPHLPGASRPSSR